MTTNNQTMQKCTPDEMPVIPCNDDTLLSPHFRFAELYRSATASRLGIDNRPPGREIDHDDELAGTPDYGYSLTIVNNARRLALQVLEPLRKAFGIPFSPSSWYRSPELERVLCEGSFKRWCRRRGISSDEDAWQRYFSRKQHPKGQAADIELPGVDNDRLFAWMRDHLPVYDQLIREMPVPGVPDSGWIHVSITPHLNRYQAFILPA